MIILHMISGGESGGSKKHLLSLANEMKERKSKNIILCFIEGELYKEAKAMGLKTYLVKQEKRFDLSIVSKIKSICKSEGVDIINSHGGRANFICYFLKKFLKVKYVTTIHSDYESDYKGNTYKTLIYTNINKIALKSFNNYIAVSENFKKLLIKRGFRENRIFTVYNGIDTKETISTLDYNEIIDKYSLKIFKRYIVMVARLHPIKGHRDFLNACELIYEQIKDTGIILVGDGSLKEELVNLIQSYKIKNNIMFVGFKEPGDFFRLAEFTVLTSYSESFPLVILESGLYGKCVVASNVGGIPEIIKSMENGLLTIPGSINDIAEKLTLLLENSSFSKEFGDRLREDVLNKFSIKALADSYEEIWNNILMGE
ncbi:glycosyltransferase family 4 protein [Clostridium cylindrosporum]|uniref:Glycosyltransferase n=1 Tax=Clostridium cylindrosporum DSM 605 TaxID=1121307 RepID=A0A0J8DEF1_CLOCY|nr:glycosyltransferase family 4 protein [Clostridium cylindrosporum]KMT22604.1 glycosyltransferase [Clostridium cylindrosporum DSM 605]